MGVAVAVSLTTPDVILVVVHTATPPVFLVVSGMVLFLHAVVVVRGAHCERVVVRSR